MTELESEKLKAGILLFQEGNYFDAHDMWEEVWQDLSGHKRIFWQSLIQISVACYHIENGNRKGAEGMLEKASHKISSLQLQMSHQCLTQISQLIQVLKAEIAVSVFSTETVQFMNEIITDDLLSFA